MSNGKQERPTVNNQTPLSDLQLDMLEFLSRQHCNNPSKSKPIGYFTRRFDSERGYKRAFKELKNLSFICLKHARQGDKVYLGWPGLTKRILLERRGISIGNETKL